MCVRACVRACVRKILLLCSSLDLEPDCEWMFKNFEDRVEKRKAEMEGLVKAKEYNSQCKQN